MLPKVHRRHLCWHRPVAVEILLFELLRKIFANIIHVSVRTIKEAKIEDHTPER